jgi:hypothetical protein
MAGEPDQFAAIPGLHEPPDEHPDWYAEERAPEDSDPVIDDPEVDVEDDVTGRPAGEHEDRGGGVPVFATLEEWVESYLLNVYRRSVDGTAMTWCREWWRHPEAYLRLDALWRAWEFLRQQPATGMAVWMRDYCDPHMGALLSESGPFKGCEPTRHTAYELRPLPTVAPPSWGALTAGYEGLRSREWEPDGP